MAFSAITCAALAAASGLALGSPSRATGRSTAPSTAIAPRPWACIGRTGEGGSYRRKRTRVADIASCDEARPSLRNGVIFP
jgi:hypothetical protein